MGRREMEITLRKAAVIVNFRKVEFKKEAFTLIQRRLPVIKLHLALERNWFFCCGSDSVTTGPHPA